MNLYWQSYKYALGWALFICLLSFWPAKEFENKSVNGFDLAVHFFLYTFFTLLLIIGNIRKIQYSRLGKYPLLFAFFISVVFGFSIEVLQQTISKSRLFDWWDVLANTAGSVIGLVFFIHIFGQPYNYWSWGKKNKLLRARFKK